MKNKSIASGFGIGVIIMAIAAVVALPIRTMQFFTVLEGESGFYREADWSVYLLYGVLALSIVAILVYGIFSRKRLDYSLEVSKRPGMGVVSMAAALGVLLDAAFCITSAMKIEEISSGLSTANYVEGMTQGDGVILTAEAVFAVFTSIYLVVLGFSYLSGKTNGSEYRLISLAPVIWSIFRLVYRFKRTISFVRVSDLLFEMIMICFMIMFFFAFAQVNSRVGGKGNEWKIAAYGIPAALLALVCFIPRFIVTITGNAQLLYSYSAAEYCDFGVALFIISAVLTRVTDKLPEAKNEE